MTDLENTVLDISPNPPPNSEEFSENTSKLRANRLVAFFMALLCIVVFFMSVQRIQGEMAAYYRAQSPAVALFSTAGDGLEVSPDSMEGIYYALESCDTAMNGITVSLMASEARNRAAEQCLTLAQELLAASPSLSFAHLVMAQAADLLDRSEMLEAALVSSESTSGGLVWMAQRRTNLAFPNLDDLAPAAHAALSRDIARLAQSSVGRPALADIYLRNPDRRDPIVAIIEGLDEETQQRFVSMVRRQGL